MQPRIGACRAASRTFSVTSRRNAALSAAASSGVSSGISRVFARPGIGALAMTPIAQSPDGSRGGCTAQIPLNQL